MSVLLAHYRPKRTAGRGNTYFAIARFCGRKYHVVKKNTVCGKKYLELQDNINISVSVKSDKI